MHVVLKNIRIIRDIEGYSQEYMADRLGITQSSYARFENGVKKIDLNTLEGVAKVFKTTVSALLDFDAATKYLPGIPTSGMVNDEDVAYERHNLEVTQLKQTIQHQSAMIRQLTAHVDDKDEIIRLLKQVPPSGPEKE